MRLCLSTTKWKGCKEVAEALEFWDFFKLFVIHLDKNPENSYELLWVIHQFIEVELFQKCYGLFWEDYHLSFFSLSLSERRYQKKSTGKIEQALKLRVQFVISCDMIVFSFFTISGQLTLKVNLKTNQTAIKQSWNFYLDCVISPGQVFPCMFGKAGFVSFFLCRKHSNKLHKESGNFHI